MSTLSYHAGELKAQKLAEASQMAARLEGMLRPEFSLGGAQFLASIQMAFLTYLDQSGSPRLSWIYGEERFAQVVGPSTLNIGVEKLHWGGEAEVRNALLSHSELGLIAIDFATRRRFRVNGRGTFRGEILQIEANQAYGNCPKFIQKRFLPIGDTLSLGEAEHSKGKILPQDLAEQIRKSDTFIVGSRNKEGQVDASHRGGNPGFVEILDSQTLRIPDYSGNNMFNTLGNFQSDSRSVLLFPDFQSGSALMLLGRAEVNWKEQMQGEVIQRYWTFHIESWEFTQRSANLKMELLEYSPFNP